MKRLLAIFLGLTLALRVAAPGGDPVTHLRLEWDPLNVATMYRVFFAESPRDYTRFVDVMAPATSLCLDAMFPGTTYMCVTAFDADGNESDYGDEVSYTQQPAAFRIRRDGFLEVDPADTSPRFSVYSTDDVTATLTEINTWDDHLIPINYAGEKRFFKVYKRGTLPP